ncbi:unnamed protein product [Rotaria sordida]|uniref:Uncharacterized protein n=1 Tax=Rotaria sordida TaxID=392033 RepID=A0A815FKT6_9BILA|nr:unnamed protein product [Rotaria sordida]CAF1589263.1 unnamed protein product [Rotaria sordida]
MGKNLLLNIYQNSSRLILNSLLETLAEKYLLDFVLHFGFTKIGLLLMIQVVPFFTVPYFAPTSINDSSAPVPSNCTTLLAEQHIVFYDRITQLIFESNRWQLPYR